MHFLKVTVNDSTPGLKVPTSVKSLRRTVVSKNVLTNWKQHYVFLPKIRLNPVVSKVSKHFCMASAFIKEVGQRLVGRL